MMDEDSKANPIELWPLAWVALFISIAAYNITEVIVASGCPS